MQPSTLRLRAWSVMLAITSTLAACGGSKPPPPPGPDPVAVPDAAASATLPTDPNCPDPAPGADATCVQDCGPPVVRDGDQPPHYRWLTAEEVAARAQHGCPRCLDRATRIATPTGPRPVSTLRVGDLVDTVDAGGRRVAAPVLALTRVDAGPAHRVLALTLADGRAVRVSAGHPSASGHPVGDLAVGAALDGSVVVGRTEVAPGLGETWDLLPAGPTGQYWADGILLGSTLRR